MNLVLTLLLFVLAPIFTVNIKILEKKQKRRRKPNIAKMEVQRSIKIQIEIRKTKGRKGIWNILVEKEEAWGGFHFAFTLSKCDESIFIE